MGRRANPISSSRSAQWGVLSSILIGLVAMGCGDDDGGMITPDGGGESVELVIASVNNPQMQDMQMLLPQFREAYPNIDVRIIFLPENQLREEITDSVTNGNERYDLFTIGTYEVPIWANNGWLVNLQPYLDADAAYDQDDLITGITGAVSHQGDMYAVPFYGESSMLMYREDMLEAAGQTMPANPTWEQVADIARAVHDPDNGVWGICLRGLPGWGELLAPLNTVVNTYGGRWYDLDWNAQLTEQPFVDAVSFYTGLVAEAGEPNPSSFGFRECLNAYNDGQAAMWYDATVGASNFTGAAAENSGYAFAPTVNTDFAGWLWAWNLAIPSSSTHQDAAYTFASWATSKEYIQLVGQTLGWSHVPPGTRRSTYDLTEYQDVAGEFATVTENSIDNADVNGSTVDPVPYSGVQYISIPEFADLGTEVSLELKEVLDGNATVTDALTEANTLAQEVGNRYQ